MAKSKLTEEKLYETWLNIYFANELNDDMVHDLEIELREMRKHRTKTRHLLKKASDHYEQLYGRKPIVKQR